MVATFGIILWRFAASASFFRCLFAEHIADLKIRAGERVGAISRQGVPLCLELLSARRNILRQSGAYLAGIWRIQVSNRIIWSIIVPADFIRSRGLR